MRIDLDEALRFVRHTGPCGRPKRNGAPCQLSSSGGMPCVHHRTEEDEELKAFIDAVSTAIDEENRRREAWAEAYRKEREDQAVIGGGELSREDVWPFLRARKCGRVDSGEVCAERVFPFQLACRFHATAAEHDAWLLADEAHNLGREQGKKDPRPGEKVWSSAELMRRVKLKADDTRCTAEDKTGKCNQVAHEFSPRCLDHMTVAEINAVRLADAAARREEQRWRTPAKAEALAKAQQQRNTHHVGGHVPYTN